MSLNKVMLIGNVGKDPEVRYLENQGAQNATKVASFTLATTERYRDRGGELRENTEWHNIVAWRNSADVAEKFIKKGTQIYVEGKLRTRSWTDQQGQKRFTTEVVVDNLQLLGKRADNPGAGEGGYATQGGYAPQPSYQQAPAAPVRQASYDMPAGFGPQAAPAAPTIEIEAPSDDMPF